ncbi:hypothetical protein BgiBS90_023995 [Biomphalaria glabrata]|nr:hypothetical protein BgiBS90_023995 [Biomphalaria glabrata]
MKRKGPTFNQTWMEKQKQEDCSINFAGPSGMMEPEAAKVIWRSTLSLHKSSYTKMVGNGDSKTFKLLNSLKPYGHMNHVSKRLCTALRNVVKDCSKLGDSIGGRKKMEVSLVK